jgi:hypothetical protein
MGWANLVQSLDNLLVGHDQETKAVKGEQKKSVPWW